MSDVAHIAASLERAGERGGDITQAVYGRYYALCPGSRELMAHVDAYIQGRMLAEVIDLLMVEDVEGERDYLEFEIRNHASFGVRPEMYRDLFEALRTTVRDQLRSDAWSADIDAAWTRQIERILAAIEPLAAHSP